ncbi:serine/threonine kinase [Fragilaria crotonensis]|nr:serine/threonine kinase [Fragilaria crotonensis]
MSSHSDFVDLLAPTRLHFDRRSVSKVDRMEIDDDHVDAVYALLELRGVNVNRADDDVVRRLEEHERTARNKRDAKKEQKRREEGEREGERSRQESVASKEAMEEKRRRLDAAGSAAVQRVTADSRRHHVNSPSSDEANIEQDRNKLRNVMNAPSAEPVELSVEYIASCIKKDHDGKPIKLGSGSYGFVCLAQDDCLPKKVAVKIIRKAGRDEETIKEFQQTFQTELSILKKFRHPNIIALYGYSLNANKSLECLVYEYAACGSLADIFADDRKRSRLSAGIRLSIMQELVRAVDFLHTSGCDVEGKNSESIPSRYQECQHLSGRRWYLPVD